MTAATEEINESADFRACLSNLTKIPEKEFEKQFRNWMERDEIARELQSKLRFDLITNFNKTSLGKHLIAETTTNRMTLSPIVLALNTLVAEFLYAQNCHFTLSVFCTEVPFRNTMPDFESIRHFRFQEAEILEIMNAICGTSLTDWNVKNKVAKNYAANTSTSLLFFIIKALIEKSAESLQKKVTVGTNTRPITISSEKQSTSFSPPVQQSERNAKSEIYNLHFGYLNKYLMILSKKVKEMSDQFENLQRPKECYSRKQPRVRILKSSRHRKYEDLNRSLERVTENLKQMANAKRKSKHVDTIVKAIETLASQFQKCATNFENVSKDVTLTPQSSRTRIVPTEKSTSAESLQPTRRPMTVPTSAAASQTDLGEKSYTDWVNEMRYTRNGQRFLDRVSIIVEKSLRKAMEKQKQELLVENEVRMRHHSELLRIRYKQKLIEQMYFRGEEYDESAEDKQDLKESISEQFRQFEMKHFDLLSKIYESENESKMVKSQNPEEENTTVVVIETVPSEVQQVEKSRCDVEIQSVDLKMPSSTECFEQQNKTSQTCLPENSIDLQQHIRETVDEMVEEERNVNQIVFDAKLRIRELEQESNQLTEHFLGYLERQRKQKLDARDAAQCLWNDYVNEREKMKERYVGSSHKEVDKSKEYESIRNQIRNGSIFDLPKEREADKANNSSKSSSSSSQSISKFRFTNPILKAKEDFFERERKFKEEAERVLSQLPDLNSCNAPILDSEFFTRTTSNNLETPLDSAFYEHSLATLPAPKKSQALLSNSMIAHLLSDSLSGTGTDFSTLWTTTSPQIATTTATITTTATTTSTANGQSNSLIFALTAQRPQNVAINKSQRCEMFSTITTATATTTSTGLKKQITIPTTIAATLNKNNNNNYVEESNVGANFVEALQASNLHYDSKIKSDYGQKDLQQSERNNNSNSHCNNNNYNRNNNNSNNKQNTLLENVEESSKSSIRNETATRKSVLQQSMARIQQLFSPHQKQRNQQQQQQIILDDVAEEDEKSDEVTSLETEQQSNKIETIEREYKSNNQTTKVFPSSNGSKNVFNHYKNNLQLQQITTTTTTTTPSAITSATVHQQQKQHQHQREQQQTPFIEYAGDDDDGIGDGDGNAITITANIRKQQNATKTSSSNGSNKAIEAMPDWQQIGYGATSEKTAFKVKEETAKGTNELEEVVIDQMNVDSNVVEPGEVIKAESLVTVGMSTCTMPKAQQQLEIGELIECGATTGGTNFITLSSESSTASSTQLQLSVGGAGDGAREVKKSLNKRNSLHEIGSDSGSDFWA